MKKVKHLGGHDIDIFYDKAVNQLTLELGLDGETPVIELWNKNKLLLTLHIKEAIEITSIIEVLVLDYMEELNNLKKK
jgi:hypothetical protein